MRFWEIVRNLDGAGLRRAAEGLLRLLSGGDTAKDLLWAADGDTAEGLLRDFDGSAADAVIRSARLEQDMDEEWAETGMADAVFSREGLRTGGTEDDFLTETQYGETVPEAGTRRREAELASHERELRQTLEDAESVLERQCLGAALEALSSAQLRALSPGETAGIAGATKESALSFDIAAVRSGNSRSHSAGTGTGAQEFPSSGAYLGSDPEAVSEFFRRDSRRYDAGFGG